MLVDECTSRYIISTKTVYKLSRTASACISAYSSLYESKASETTRRDDTRTLTLPLIERLVKAFKIHRTEIDFNAGFVNGFDKVLQGVSANS